KSCLAVQESYLDIPPNGPTNIFESPSKGSRGPVLREWEWVLIAPAPLHWLTHCSQDHLTGTSMDTLGQHLPMGPRSQWSARILCRCY
uniref:Uncharacterized protein n=1 Tax=Hucho hucho TaxID=62062 RepID=A0A4W5PDZ9_9TELE